MQTSANSNDRETFRTLPDGRLARWWPERNWRTDDERGWTVAIGRDEVAHRLPSREAAEQLVDAIERKFLPAEAA